MTQDNINDCLELIDKQGFSYHMVVGRPSPLGTGHVNVYSNVKDPVFMKMSADITNAKLTNLLFSELMEKNNRQNPPADEFDL